MLVPLYIKNGKLYKNNNFTYQNNNYQRVDLKIFLKVLTLETLEKFSKLDGFNLDQNISVFEDKFLEYQPVAIGDNFIDFKNFLIATKLLFMTGFTSTYGFWNKNGLNNLGNNKFYTHHGIDLILPKGTPIETFSTGEIIFAGWKEEWGNVVIVRKKSEEDLKKTEEGLYLIYAHLEEIKVENGQKVKKGDIIGICGNTGNAKGYHLHFQIDTEKAPFHPYWSSLDKGFSEDEKNQYFKKILKYCIDPWKWLIEQEIGNFSYDYKCFNNLKLSSDQLPFSIKNEKDKDIIQSGQNDKKKNVNNDISDKTKEDQKQREEILDIIISKIKEEYSSIDNDIGWLVESGIIQGDKNGDLLLDKPLTRYEFALILYRIKNKGLYNIDFKNNQNINKRFTDIDWTNLSKEGKEALTFTVSNGFINGDGNKFYPGKYLTLVEFLAIIGRMVAGLKDGKNNRYQPYIDWAKKEKLLQFSDKDLFQPILRKQVFKILAKILLSSGVM